MPAFLRDPFHRTWLILLLATGASFGLRADGFAGLAVGVATLAIAYVKGRLVILDFMELRHAPLVWRAVVEGWLLVVSAVISAAYWLGTTGSGSA